jgi:hypothetical protein
MRTLSTTSRFALVAAAIAIATLLPSKILAYSASGHTWGHTPVVYFLNPSNLDLPLSSAETAMRAGADVWALQTHASFSFSYAGRSTQTTTTFDGVNLVVFRNASNNSAIATTYWWSNSAGIVDADIVFWDSAFRFFSGTSGCSGGFYIEDIAAHEFGHALGLGHSIAPNATMYPSTSSCNTRNRTLDADDIAGVEALYPPLGIPPAPPGGFRIVRP